MKKIIIKVLFFIGRSLSVFGFISGGGYFLMRIYSGFMSGKINIKEKYNFTCEKPVYFSGGKNITIKSGHLRKGTRISAIANYAGKKFNPIIEIGANFNAGINSHIGAIDSVIIGDNFLGGANCLITDHTHGINLQKESNIPPVDRQLSSKGGIIIGNNVFMGENSVILSNVHIGDNVIIGAGTVVTKDVPSNCIVVGSPMRIVKLQNNEDITN